MKVRYAIQKNHSRISRYKIKPRSILLFLIWSIFEAALVAFSVVPHPIAINHNNQAHETIILQ